MIYAAGMRIAAQTRIRPRVREPEKRKYKPTRRRARKAMVLLGMRMILLTKGFLEIPTGDFLRSSLGSRVVNETPHKTTRR
jgi:hypothetical protein